MLDGGPDTETFLRQLAEAWPHKERYELSRADTDAIEKLQREVYEKPRWVYDKIR
jgi:lipoate-protein ligase A